MLKQKEQEAVDRLESDFLQSELSVSDLSTCLAGYLKGLLVGREIYFGDENIQSTLIVFLSDAEGKKWPATETPEKKTARAYFWKQFETQSGADKVLAAFARCCVFCATNDEDWADRSLGEDTPFLLYADELERMSQGQAERLVNYFRSKLNLGRDSSWLHPNERIR